MAELTKAGTPSVSTVSPLAANLLGGLRAGEDLAAGDACYIDQNVWVDRSIGAVAGASVDQTVRVEDGTGVGQPGGCRSPHQQSDPRGKRRAVYPAVARRRPAPAPARVRPVVGLGTWPVPGQAEHPDP